MSNIVLAAGGDDGGYQISRSVRLRASAGAYLQRTFSTPTDGKKWTYSFWMKKSKDVATLGHGSGHLLCSAGAGAQGFLGFGWNTNGEIILGYGGYGRRYTNGFYRDPTAWYHVVVAVDTTQATESNRAKLYVNGASVAWVTATAIGLNDTTQINQAVTTNIGAQTGQPYETFDGLFTEMYFIDGQQLDSSSFGETDVITGVWKPKKYLGTYGNNGFYLKFDDNSAATAAAIGKDSSGNGNNWTPNNISVTGGVTYDSMIDVPTMYADGGNGRGNYWTLNPLDVHNASISQANLRVNGGSASAGNASSQELPTTGKWYWECYVAAVGGETSLGLRKSQTPNDTSGASGYYVGSLSGDIGYYFSNGNKYISGTGSAYGAAYTTGDTIGIAYDADNNQITFYKNNSSQGAITGATDKPYKACFEYRTAGGTNDLYINFGQRPFAYTPPTGFKALNTQNLPDATITNGKKYFDVATWTGDGTTNRNIGGFAFQPDLVWTKTRSIGPTNHELFDSVRGAGTALFSNLTNAEASDTDFVQFNTDGFRVTAGANNTQNVSARTYVGWQWKKGATPGFDIVTYTGDGTTSASRTIAHSLGVKPAFIITKKRSSGTDYGWSCWHKDLGGNYGIWLHSTAARNANMWGGHASISSTVFTPPDLSYGNESGATYVNYLFAEVAGFSRFGSYTGNGSSDGVFVHLGFLPRFIMLKRTDSTGWWYVWDTARQSFNIQGPALFPNSSSAESVYSGGASLGLDVLSNGFKLRGSQTEQNASGGTYIYAAFAENPFKNSLAR